MDTSEFYDYENRAYINPTLSSGEQEQFISNLRDIQNQNNAQIQEQTYNLGTQVPSNLGGLGGGEAYFNARYQTPQVDEMVATLKSAAQAQALQDVMSNYQAQLKNRYSQAQRNYRKRQAARARAAAAPTTNSTSKNGNVNVTVGSSPNNFEGLAFEQWSKENNFDQFVQPQTVKDALNQGVPIESIINADNALKNRTSTNTKSSVPALTPFYSGQLF